jgi:nickel-dependent lactate racemase
LKKNFSLKYGNEIINFSLPENFQVEFLNLKNLPPIKDISKILKESSLPFIEKFKKNEKVSIIVSDKTRVTGAKFFLNPLKYLLNSKGIKDENIQIVFAIGTHTPHTEREQIEIIGEEIAKNIKFFDHNCFSKNSYLGKTKSGTEIYINEEVLNSERIILTGSVTFHYYAGFSGGRKSILPGISSYKTVCQNHSLILNPEGSGMHPFAKRGILKNNPVHLDMVETAKKLKVDFILNTVINEENQISQIFIGEIFKTHLLACNFVQENFGVKIKEKADLIIASCGGFPFDINFYQSHKAIDNLYTGVKEGGVIILLAECREGLGSEKFKEWIENNNSLKEIEKKLRVKFEVPGHTTYSLLEKAEKFNIIVISTLPEKILKKMKMKKVENIEEGISLAKKILGDKIKTYIVPKAYLTVPIYDSCQA